MYRLCPHVDIRDGTPEERADIICGLSIRSLLHVLNCIPLDPLPPRESVAQGEAYMMNSLRMGITKVIEEKVDA